MILNLITKDTVKSQLNICDTTYDSDIDAMIPIVSNDIRRILNNKYDEYEVVTITDTSPNVTIVQESIFTQYRYTTPKYIMGQIVYSPAFPEDTYIISYNPDNYTYTMNNDATADGTYFYPTVSISQWPTISKMIMYRISQKTSDTGTEKLTSITYGNVSKTFSTEEINSRYNYPQTYIDDLGPRRERIG